MDMFSRNIIFKIHPHDTWESPGTSIKIQNICILKIDMMYLDDVSWWCILKKFSRHLHQVTLSRYLHHDTCSRHIIIKIHIFTIKRHVHDTSLLQDTCQCFQETSSWFQETWCLDGVLKMYLGENSMYLEDSVLKNGHLCLDDVSWRHVACILKIVSWNMVICILMMCLGDIFMYLEVSVLMMCLDDIFMYLEGSVLKYGNLCLDDVSW